MSLTMDTNSMVGMKHKLHRTFHSKLISYRNYQSQLLLAYHLQQEYTIRNTPWCHGHLVQPLQVRLTRIRKASLSTQYGWMELELEHACF